MSTILTIKSAVKHTIARGTLHKYFKPSRMHITDSTTVNITEKHTNMTAVNKMPLLLRAESKKAYIRKQRCIEALCNFIFPRTLVGERWRDIQDEVEYQVADVRYFRDHGATRVLCTRTPFQCHKDYSSRTAIQMKSIIIDYDYVANQIKVFKEATTSAKSILKDYRQTARQTPADEPCLRQGNIVEKTDTEDYRQPHCNTMRGNDSDQPNKLRRMDKSGAN